MVYNETTNNRERQLKLPHLFLLRVIGKDSSRVSMNNKVRRETDIEGSEGSFIFEEIMSSYISAVSSGIVIRARQNS